MDQSGQPGVPGPEGRKLHIAHRRSPSELTPLMSTFPNICEIHPGRVWTVVVTD